MLSFLNAMLGDHSRLQTEKDDRLFHVALDAAPIAVVITDATHAEHPIVYVNARFCQVTGYRPDEVLGRGLEILQRPETGCSQEGLLEQAVGQDHPIPVELVCHRKDGQTFWMRAEFTPITDENGQVARHVGVMSEITETRRSAEELRAREERLRAITEAIPLPMVIVDGDGTVIDANTHAASLLRIEPLRGRQLNDFLDFNEVMDAVRRNGRIQQIEMQVRTANGETLWALGSAVLFCMDRQDVAIVVFVDISEQKQKEAELSRAKDEAERTIRAKSRFFAAASHDLRQPLQALALFTTALEMHVAAGTAQNILSSIKLSLATMEEMFDALLDMSRLDAGVLRAAPEAFMVNDVLERLEVEFMPQAERKRLRLHVVPSSAAVWSDPALLGRILRNFLSNAVRYTQKGKILLGCKREGNNLRIVVADTGPGIPEDQRLAIFEEFYQGRNSGGASSSGLGLGLAIVQRLARLLSHRLDVRSILGQGAAFSVEVPLAEAPGPSPEDAKEEGEGPSDLSGKTVLVIDDDPSVRLGLTVLLKDWDCRVIAVADGAEALAVLRERQKLPDVILTDLSLEDKERAGKAIDHVLDNLGIDVPAFVFTGDTDARDGEVGSPGRRYRVLHKPLNPLKLRTVLAEAMGVDG